MKYATLGTTDLEVSRITFGCWELGGGPWDFTSDENNLRALRHALDNGVTSFDSAEGYGAGHSEEIVGKALAGRRSECVIATKVSPKNLHAADIRTSIEGSLKRLATDYVDLYYIHWPNEEIPIEETMTELIRLKEEGLIRAIGVSNFSVEQLKEALEYGRIDAHQPEYSLLHRDIEQGLLQFCHENKISVMSYSSVAKGILTGAFHFGGAKIEETDFRSERQFFLKGQLEKEQDLLDAMKRLADSKSVSVAQIAIAWLLHQQGLTSAIVGTQNEKHLLDNLASVDLELSSDEVARLSAISMQVIKRL